MEILKELQEVAETKLKEFNPQVILNRVGMFILNNDGSHRFTVAAELNCQIGAGCGNTINEAIEKCIKSFEIYNKDNVKRLNLEA